MRQVGRRGDRHRRGDRGRPAHDDLARRHRRVDPAGDRRRRPGLQPATGPPGWAATGHAKRGGGKAAAPAADDNAGGEGGDKAAAPAAGGDEKGGGAPASESLDTTDQEPAKIEESLTETKKQGPTSTLSWQDIVVVPRKAFLKGGRLELGPFAGVTVNDNLIRHYVFGADLNYFLTDALWVGLQGQYFVKQLETQAFIYGLLGLTDA